MFRKTVKALRKDYIYIYILFLESGVIGGRGTKTHFKHMIVSRGISRFASPPEYSNYRPANYACIRMFYLF